MQLRKTIQALFPQHKYAINSTLLGDESLLAWSNLGYWSAQQRSYPEACRQLADQLVQAIALKDTDHVLDLGCGQGASLLHWSQHYHLSHFSAVELQKACVEQIQQQCIPGLDAIYASSFMQLREPELEQAFDVVLCIDAAYHHAFSKFLNVAHRMLKPQGRLAFHYLVRSPRWQTLSSFKQLQYRYLLKAADIDVDTLPEQQQAEEMLFESGFSRCQFTDLSEAVLAGFANYVDQLAKTGLKAAGLDGFKILMTAKLCDKLYREGCLNYVQISAERAAESQC